MLNLPRVPENGQSTSMSCRAPVRTQGAQRPQGEPGRGAGRSRGLLPRSAGRFREASLRRRVPLQRQMGAPVVVVVQPRGDHPAGVATADRFLRADGLALRRPPQTLDEPVVNPPPPAVHADPHTRREQRAQACLACELAALAGVRDQRRPMALQRLLKRARAESRLQGVVQLPGRNEPARPVHDRHQVQVPAPHRNAGDVRTDRLSGQDMVKPAKETGMDPATGPRLRGARPRMHRAPVHRRHQATRQVPARVAAFPAQMQARAARAAVRELHARPVRQRQKLQPAPVLRSRLAVQRRTAHPRQCAFARQRQGPVLADQPRPLGPPKRSKPRERNPAPPSTRRSGRASAPPADPFRGPPTCPCRRQAPPAHLQQTLVRLRLPIARPVRVHAEARCDRANRLFAPKRLQNHPALERRRELPPLHGQSPVR